MTEPGSGESTDTGAAPPAGDSEECRGKLDPERVLRECDLQFVRAGGPGGQHRNRRETGVRLTHRPTGIVVTATERRSQVANRRLALLRMVERLERRLRRRKPRKPSHKSRGVKSRERTERERLADLKARRRKPTDSE